MSGKGFWATQDGKVVNLIPPVSAGAALTGVRFNMAMWEHASLLVRFGAAGGPAGAITLNVYLAESGGTGVAVPFKYALQNAASAPFDVFTEWVQATSTGYTPVEVADEIIGIELDADDVLVAANGTYVEVDVAVGSLGTTAQLIDGFGLLSGGRYTSDLSATAQT
jgi:hypothetical protein